MTSKCSLVVAFVGTLLALQLEAETKFPYKLTRPIELHHLSPRLAEVSGCVLTQSGFLACVEDETGQLYFLEQKNFQIERSVFFGPPGDYEDLAVDGTTAWILRSDGVIFEVKQFDGNRPKTSVLKLRLPTGEFEGLFWDAAQKRLLVASKSKFEIFLVDPVGLTIAPMKLHRWKTGADDGPSRISGIALEPASHELYLLSSENHRLWTYHQDGRPLGTSVVDKGLLPKPEGLAFKLSGELILTSEAAGGTARLALFPRD